MGARESLLPSSLPDGVQQATELSGQSIDVAAYSGIPTCPPGVLRISSLMRRFPTEFTLPNKNGSALDGLLPRLIPFQRIAIMVRFVLAVPTKAI